MALVPRNVTLSASFTSNVQLVDVIGFDGSPVTLQPGEAIDLLAYAADEDLAKSAHLKNLNADGHLTVNSTFDTAATQAPAAGILTVISSAAGAGGAATEAMTVTGLLTTDTIIAVAQRVQGANALPLLGWSTQIADGITCAWSADPGAGAIVDVTIKRD